MDAAGGLLTPKQLTEEELAGKQRLQQAGDRAFDDEDYARALDSYHRASLIDGCDAAIWSALGLTYSNLELPREAWRSYKLALACDPENLDTLWYAAEFLFNLEDFALARVLFARYISLEKDAGKLEEAREFLAEAVRQAGSEEEAADDEEEDEDDEFAGMEIEGEEDDFDSDDDDDDWDDDEEPEDEAPGFVAGLNLELTGSAGKCMHCGIGLPADAPYCYNCRAPHLYKDV